MASSLCHLKFLRYSTCRKLSGVYTSGIDERVGMGERRRKTRENIRVGRGIE